MTWRIQLSMALEDSPLLFSSSSSSSSLTHSHSANATSEMSPFKLLLPANIESGFFPWKPIKPLGHV